MKQFFRTRCFKHKKNELQYGLVILTFVVFNTAFAYDLKAYKNAPAVTDKTVQSVNKPSVQDEDVCIGVVCDCVDNVFICVPAGCSTVDGNGCSGSSQSSNTPLNSRTIPAISQPSVTNPTRQIDPKALPGDQFDPKALPGD